MPPHVEAAAVARPNARVHAARSSTFEFEPAGADVVMHISVLPDQVVVLDAIESRVRR